MKPQERRLLVLVVSLVVVAVTAQTSFTPIWPTVGGNPGRSGQTDLNGPSKCKLKWGFSAQATPTSPVISATTADLEEGLLYIADYTGTLYAVHTRNGTLRWSLKTGGSRAPVLGTKQGQQRIYHAGNSSLYVIDALYGTILKEVPMIDDYFRGSPLSVWKDNTQGVEIVYALCSSTNQSVASAYLRAVQPYATTTPTIQWEYPLPAGFRPPFESISIDQSGTVFYVTGDADVAAVDRTGQPKWKYSMRAKLDPQGATPFSQGAPAVGGGLVVVGYYCSHIILNCTNEGGVVALSSSGGMLYWHYPLKDAAVIASAAIDVQRETVYVGDDAGVLHAINMKSGLVRFRAWTGAPIVNAPIVGADGAVFFQNMAGKMWAIDSQGTPLWASGTGEPIYANGSPGAFGVGKTYYIVTGQSIHAIDEDSGLDCPIPH